MFFIATVDHFAYKSWSIELIAHKPVANLSRHKQQVKRYIDDFDGAVDESRRSRRKGEVRFSLTRPRADV